MRTAENAFFSILTVADDFLLAGDGLRFYRRLSLSNGTGSRLAIELALKRLAYVGEKRQRLS